MDSKFYIEIAILGIIVLHCIFCVVWQIKKKGLRKVAVDLIVYAEKNFKYNEDKFNYCVNTLINKFIPAPFNFFVTTESIEKLVQTTFDMVKKALDYREEK